MIIVWNYTRDTEIEGQRENATKDQNPSTITLTTTTIIITSTTTPRSLQQASVWLVKNETRVLRKQNKTKQNKTKQNKTKQNKTKQNKTKQNKKQLILKNERSQQQTHKDIGHNKGPGQSRA